MTKKTVWLVASIIVWQMFLLITALALWHCLRETSNLYHECTYIGTLGGVLYCLRAVYRHLGEGDWDSKWAVWYFLRPIASSLAGFVSCLFLSAGMLTLGTSELNAASPNYGYWVFAFIAGYNVDCFLQKMESLARETWGIQESTNYKNQQEQDKNEGE